ncbi:MAG: hypothetical protein ACAI25_10165, partial [Planctomycetota bacterium]
MKRSLALLVLAASVGCGSTDPPPETPPRTQDSKPTPVKPDPPKPDPAKPDPAKPDPPKTGGTTNPSKAPEGDVVGRA